MRTKIDERIRKGRTIYFQGRRGWIGDNSEHLVTFCCRENGKNGYDGYENMSVVIAWALFVDSEWVNERNTDNVF